MKPAAKTSGTAAPVTELGRRVLVVRWVRWMALLGLCAAYLQGGLVKAFDFGAAIAEMQHFSLSPAAPFAAIVIAFEIGASLMILAGWYRWLAALALAGFTLFATLLANQFWGMAGHDRFMAENSFFEHLGLVGGFLLVAWHDLEQSGSRGQLIAATSHMHSYRSPH